jgi:hypothetical protein
MMSWLMPSSFIAIMGTMAKASLISQSRHRWHSRQRGRALFGSRHRRGGELLRFVRVACLRNDGGENFLALLLRIAAAHQHECGGAIGNGGGVGGGDGAVWREGGLQRRNFIRLGFARQFVGVERAGFQFDRRDLAFETAFGGGALRAAERFERIRVLGLATELVLLRGLIGIDAHGVALVRVFKTIERHVIEELVVAVLLAAAMLLHEERCARHAFHAAGDDDVALAGDQSLARHGDGLQAGAAHLVQRDRLRAVIEASFQCSLTRGGLAEASREHVAHEDRVGALGACFLHRGFHGDGAEIGRGEVRELA